jgi:hypothetical protein
MKTRSAVSSILSFAVLATASLPGFAQSQGSPEIYFDRNCRQNQRLQLIDRFTVFYQSAFKTNGKIYWLYAVRYQDGAVLLCVSKPNFSEPKALEELQYQFIRKIVRSRSNNSIFLITVAEGNGRNPVITDYTLDLQNPSKPLLTKLQAK